MQPGKRGCPNRVEKAENTSFGSNSVDLITVAQALHWFNIKAFENEVVRVLKTNGVLAVWSYGLLDICLFDKAPAINKVINHLYCSILEPYWPPERNMVEEGYKDITFPFQSIEAPSFLMTSEWDLSQLIGYLYTWSAVKQYEAREGINPVASLHEALFGLWGDPERKMVIQWPLTLRVWVKTT